MRVEMTELRRLAELVARRRDGLANELGWMDRRRSMSKRTVSRKRLCVSPGIHREYDRALFAAAGRYSDGSGYGGQRDHYWVTRTAKEARVIAEALMGMPGLTRLTMSEDILATREILEVARRQRRHRRGGKRLRLVRGR